MAIVALADFLDCQVAILHRVIGSMVPREQYDSVALEAYQARTQLTLHQTPQPEEHHNPHQHKQAPDGALFSTVTMKA